MIKIIAIGLMLLNSHTAEYLPSFACQVNNIGLNSAVSLALGQGHNNDGWIEGSLVIDLHFSRESAEFAVNFAHTALFGGPVTEMLDADFGDCE